ncbi:glycosyltransferase [Flaviflexus huanghaiensis]|uniref:glycosyltransferase n=1 Tax=Flaviflexus huanghaiensis TaxID=1111473 RepID=UPI0015FA22DD|nr:glycosyltransferase [Flaviflexus huanghaiensis]
MRVVAVSTWFPTKRAPSSGAFVVKDVLAIEDAGNEVKLVHLVSPHQDDGTRHVVHEGITVLRMPFDPKNPVDMAAVVRQLPSVLEGADLVHSMAVSSLGPLALLKAAGKLDVPWVHTEHWSGLTNPETLTPFLWASRPAVGAALKAPDTVTAVCDYLADPIRSYRGDRSVQVVPCIVPGASEIIEPRSVEEVGELRMVTVGGLIERKNPMMALDVTEELLRRGVNARMIFVGDGPLRDAIEERAEKEPLRGHVTLTGNLDRAGVVQALNDSHVFLGPTKGDNFFVSCAEAIAQGRPVVVSDKGGQGEYVKPIAGRVLSDATAAEYADAVLEVVGSATAQEIADSIGTDFHPDSVGYGYRNVYDNLLAGRL